MHYSLKNNMSKEMMFYVIAAILIMAFIMMGIRGRKSAQEYTDEEQNQGISTQSPTQKNNEQISVYNHDTNEILYMDIENYVVGAVAKEMPASFSMEALKAQAVAARTIAYKHLNLGMGCNNCDLCTSPAHVQGYASVEDRQLLWGDEYQKWESIVEAAVKETAGEAIYYDGELIDVLYHASSNGQTENSIDVFSSSREYLVGVASPDENLVKDEIRLSKSDFANKVNSAYPSAGLKANKIKEQIKIVSYTASGRVENVKIGDITIDGVAFRQLFSIKSTDFSFIFLDNEIVVSTLGYGHGVGMSQRGANEMAKNGYSYVDILTHYYTGVSVLNYDK